MEISWGSSRLQNKSSNKPRTFINLSTFHLVVQETSADTATSSVYKTMYTYVLLANLPAKENCVYRVMLITAALASLCIFVFPQTYST